jgi:hypothetical protein
MRVRGGVTVWAGRPEGLERAEVFAGQWGSGAYPLVPQRRHPSRITNLLWTDHVVMTTVSHDCSLVLRYLSIDNGTSNALGHRKLFPAAG